MQNNRLFTKKKTLELLTKLDKELGKEGYQRKFELYCMGGTKMVLSGLRNNSKDVDFLLSREDFRVFSSYIAELDLREGVRFDVFPDGALPGYNFEKFREHAKRTPYSFEHIDLYFIDDIDFLITKALAGRDKDRKDIKILLGKNHISKKEIMERFKHIKFNSDKEKELKNKFENFLREFYS